MWHCRKLEAILKQSVHLQGDISSVRPVVVRVLWKVAGLDSEQVLLHGLGLDAHRTQDIMDLEYPHADSGEWPAVGASFQGQGT